MQDRNRVDMSSGRATPFDPLTDLYFEVQVLHGVDTSPAISPGLPIPSSPRARRGWAVLHLSVICAIPGEAAGPHPSAILGVALATFGNLTGVATSVNFWDPTDPEFVQALALFDVQAPPALVLAGGVRPERKADPPPLDPADLYAICITEPTVLGDATRLAAAVNSAHEVLMRGNPKEITGYLRQQAAASLLAAVGRIASEVRDQILALRPKFLLPGGASLQIG